MSPAGCSSASLLVGAPGSPHSFLGYSQALHCEVQARSELIRAMIMKNQLALTQPHQCNIQPSSPSRVLPKEKPPRWATSGALSACPGSAGTLRDTFLVCPGLFLQPGPDTRVACSKVDVPPPSRWRDEFRHARKGVDKTLILWEHSHSGTAVSMGKPPETSPQSSPSALAPQQPFHIHHLTYTPGEAGPPCAAKTTMAPKKHIPISPVLLLPRVPGPLPPTWG